MKAVSLLFRITGALVFIQILLGGLLTFNFMDPTFHIVTGLIVFVVAIATMIMVLKSKPVLPPLRGLSIGLVVLIVAQMILGIETLRLGSDSLAWVHFAVALGIYGMTVAGTFMAAQSNNIANPPQGKPPEGV